jgi:TRAP-type C4-dicarboxylate transport system permease small subunit
MHCPTCGAEIEGIVQGNVCPGCHRSLGSTNPVLRVIALIEDTVISIMICSMVLLVLVQIALRNIYASGIIGGAEVVRHLVLWVAFLGAGIAAREGKHIRIDVIYRILPFGLKHFAEILTGLFTTIVCGILLYASIQFIRTDYSLGTSIAFFNLPVWIFEVVIPIGYGIVTVRYAAQSIGSFLKILKGD